LVTDLAKASVVLGRIADSSGGAAEAVSDATQHQRQMTERLRETASTLAQAAQSLDAVVRRFNAGSA
jgi:methyl-accepting chemotaxis protein